MANESYNDHLASLNLASSATEEEIRAAISLEQRKCQQKQNSPVIERRQDAERRLKALSDAEKVLLGAEGVAVRLVRQGSASSAGGSASGGGAPGVPMTQAYRNHLALLNLPIGATEDQIRTALAAEQRAWSAKANAPSMELRQAAERKIDALDEAGRVLLGAEGAAMRRSGALVGQSAEVAAPTADADTIARAIERVALARGAKKQERYADAVLKSSTVFHKGIDYRVEEVVHKKFESIKDMKTCIAQRGASKLFEWVVTPVEPAGQPSVRVNSAGAWVTEIVALAATLQAK